MSKSKWKSFSEEEIREIVLNSKNNAEVAEKLGYSKTGGSSFRAIKQMYEYYNIDTSHFLGQGWNKNNFDYSRFQKGKVIKSASAIYAIVALRGHKCENCQLSEWLGKPITLEVHHKDGDHQNNELKNLQLLCPNCHSYTDNWRGKNINTEIKRKGKFVTDEVLIEALKTQSSIRKALLSVGLSGTGGNYSRAYNIIYQNNIENLKK